MVVRKQAKIKCRKWDCWSSNCGIKKLRGYKSIIHTFIKIIKDKTNDDDDDHNNNNNNNNNIKTKTIEYNDPIKEKR